MRGKTKPTASDVAALAGVSQSAVSMILNQKKNLSFSAETIQRVLDAAEALGYTIRPRTASPVQRFEKDTILIVCPVLSNPYYSALVQAIEQQAVAQGFSTLICNTYRDLLKEQEYLSMFESSGICGIIFTFIPQSCDRVERLSTRVPVVVIGDRNTTLNVDTVEIDSIHSGRLVAEHLLSLGHRHVAFISTTLSEQAAVRLKRLEGFCTAFQEVFPNGSVEVKSRTITPSMDLSDPAVEQRVGQELTKECLGDRRITAFVAVNDMVAYGVLHAIHEAGFTVPRDYSVCGFDNIFPSGLPPVSLTTVEHYMAEKGHNAVHILCARLRSDSSHSASITRVEYRPRLIARDSTGKVRLPRSD